MVQVRCLVPSVKRPQKESMEVAAVMKNIPKLQKNLWPVCISEPFLNCRRIYPIQQAKIQKMLRCLTGDDNVKKIIVFGSSTQNRCHVGSDVDVYVELAQNKKMNLNGIDFAYDVWTNFTVDDRMYRKIREEGVIVYGK